jgi:hypothetical protein
MYMKIPGVKAKKSGTKLKRGRALQVMTYPRSKTKAVLVEAARRANVSLSSYMVLASLKEAAHDQEREISDLGLPPDELRHYRTPRVDPKRSAAAKRAWATIRAKRKVTQLDKVDRQQPVVSLEGVADLLRTKQAVA